MASRKSVVPDEVRQQCGDVLLVGGTFFLRNAKVVLSNGVSFPVDVDLKISRCGITFPKVRLTDEFKKSNGMAQRTKGRVL